VSGEQFAVLVHLWDRDGRTQQELADEINKDKTTVTRLITSIESHALVKRVRDKNDERLRRIWLTKRGKKLMNELTVMAQEILISGQAGISAKDVAICKDVLAKVHETLSIRVSRRLDK
jgi:DNA-binding MarR family transcriptional regulator